MTLITCTTLVLFSLGIFCIKFNLGCLPGETWYEKCKKCTCNEKREINCQTSKCSNLALCFGELSWFDNSKRCYCENSMTYSVCVDLKYQEKMNKMPCYGVSYYFDPCTLCTCQGNYTACTRYENCYNPRAGVCNEGKNLIEKCFNCTCTHTRFYHCSLIEKCYTKQVKSGKCNKYDESTNLKCTSYLEQECENDYECPGDQKCCNEGKCIFRCKTPIF